MISIELLQSHFAFLVKYQGFRSLTHNQKVSLPMQYLDLMFLVLMGSLKVGQLVNRSLLYL